VPVDVIAIFTLDTSSISRANGGADVVGGRRKLKQRGLPAEYSGSL
jgi:hypothetical protein